MKNHWLKKKSKREAIKKEEFFRDSIEAIYKKEFLTLSSVSTDFIDGKSEQLDNFTITTGTTHPSYTVVGEELEDSEWSNFTWVVDVSN